jgi:hypothetical protein
MRQFRKSIYKVPVSFVQWWWNGRCHQNTWQVLVIEFKQDVNGSAAGDHPFSLKIDRIA